MGAMEVADDAMWGASTERAVRNFPISGQRLPAAFIQSLALIKLAAAQVNQSAGRLAPEISTHIQRAAREIIQGQFATQFPVDIFQTGSGTSTNVNMNEVIAFRATQFAAATMAGAVHPNDHVNMSQSSNDVIPTALHVSVAIALRDRLIPALEELGAVLKTQSTAFDSILKIGRTHLMDAVPLTLGQEFSGYARQIDKAVERIRRAIGALSELAIGGTAVGTGLNAPEGFGANVCRVLSAESGLQFTEARNHFEAQAARDDCVEAAGLLLAVIASLTKLANDLRLLASGPRAGLAELKLPATQPGSSIMPGKINPVMCEMLLQVGLYAQGQLQTVMACGREGQLELNATLPLIAHCLHESVRCLANGIRVFVARCVRGIEVDADRCAELTERSLMLVTALVPRLGYDVAAEVAKDAFATGKSLREVVLERRLLDAGQLDAALDPLRMTRAAGNVEPGDGRTAAHPAGRLTSDKDAPA